MTDKDVERLPDDPKELKGMLKLQFREIERLKFQLAQAQKSRFGKRSERHAPGTPTLFDLGEEDAAQETQPEAEAPSTAASADKTPAKPRGRKPLPKTLPRTRVEHCLPVSELACPCCGETRSQCGWTTSEQLEYEPAKLYVIEHARAKYACRHCEEQMVVAPKPAQPIEKGIGGPGLIAAIGVGKFSDHLPLYRLEEILSRSGFLLPRGTQSRWLKRIAALLEPLVARMRTKILSGRVIWTDDTVIPVLEEGRGSTKTGRIWVYIGDRDHRYAVFDYSPDRKGSRPREFLEGYSGYLQADAYSGYDELYEGGRVIEVACWAHARRKFVDAKDVAPVVSKHVIERIKELYAIEHRAQKQSMSSADLAACRQEQALPKLNALFDWLTTQSTSLLPKNPVAEAVQYALRHQIALRRYVEDGDLSIDNNLSERTLRCVAVGRKNWLFAGNDEAGETAAVLMSLIATCKERGVDPYLYLRDVLTRLPQQATLDDATLDAFLPDAWLATHPAAKLIERA